MAQLASQLFKFLGSTSPDCVDHRLYYIESPAPVDYESPFVSAGNTRDAEGYVHGDFAALLGHLNLDGIFNIGIAAVDDGGNESDTSKAFDFPLDFQAPNAPGPIVTL